MTGSSRGFSRRAFVRSAVAIGGVSALAACLERESDDEEFPQAAVDPDDLPERQHAWNEWLATDEHGNDVSPEHHVVLTLEYVGDDPDEDREQVEAAFRTLERAYERGSDGLVFTVGYSPAYFDRFDGSVPDSVDLPHPEPLSSSENPALDDHDALIHLASDYGSVVMSAEQALTGELEGELNGIELEETLEGVFEVDGRRTGFIGEGLPAENQEDLSEIADQRPIEDDAPLLMGFKSGFKANQASEERVTIQEGPFEDGTTTHLSRIQLNLRQWYLQDNRNQRVSKMFCPVHASEDRVEGAGHNLGDSAQIDDCIDTVDEDARSGVVGHSQKVAGAREDGSPIILRRDFSSTDNEQAATHFLSHQRSISDFVRTREAMNGDDFASATGSGNNNGIRHYLTVRQRSNYLVPPRRYRSLPRPDPE